MDDEMTGESSGKDVRRTDSATAAKGPTSGNSVMARRHARQRWVSLITSPIWLSMIVLAIRFYFKYRIENVESVRAEYRRIRAQSADARVCESFDSGRFVSGCVVFGIRGLLVDPSRRTPMEYTGK